jgi:predicted RNase H-like HicB family nuclease
MYPMRNRQKDLRSAARDMAAMPVPVLLTPSKDIAGQWVAHTLKLDLVTQGGSIEEAIEMAIDAVQMVVVDDLSHGLDPLERPSAEHEAWETFMRVLQNGRALSTVTDRSKLTAVAAMLSVAVPSHALPEHARPKPPRVEVVLRQAA